MFIIHLPTRKRNRQERSLTILRYGNVENSRSADGKQIFTARWKSRRLSHSPQTSFPTAPQTWPFTHIPTAPAAANIFPTIVYDHVSFGYTKTQPGPDGKPMVVEDEVLHDITFSAKAGQKTALVGESGSGKSTLAKLLIHYYDPQKGSISIGGQKLCDMSLEALNSHISYVAQDQYLT